ncbi:MAG: GntR family transcriptional regulator [Chloroflexota bacterium]
MRQNVLPALREDVSTLSEQVYNALLSAVMEWRIKPGERLVLDDLAAQLRVSRTPIRDALSRLASEGLVQPQGRRGFSITRLRPVDLRELYTLRLMCEQFAVAEGIGNVSAELLEEMAVLSGEIARLRASPDVAERLESQLKDAAFHRRVVGLARNGRLGDLFDRLNIHMHAAHVGPRPAMTKERIAASLDEHHAIVEGLRRGDVAAAQEAVRRHILAAGEGNIAALELNQATDNE